MKRMIKTYKSDGYDFGTECPTCEYCGASADETEIAENHVSGGFMCGEIECWNNYIWSEVWGRMVEITEEEINVCEACEEPIDEGDECDDCRWEREEEEEDEETKESD